jgi:hypothetical protein
MDTIHFDGNCYSDCSSAEISCSNAGNNHTEAVYLDDCRTWDTGTGDGPWFVGVLVRGFCPSLRMVCVRAVPYQNSNDPTRIGPSVTGMVKNRIDQQAICGGKAQLRVCIRTGTAHTMQVPTSGFHISSFTYDVRSKR